MSTGASTSPRRGGSWLSAAIEPGEVFTPEMTSDEHKLIARTTEEFVANEVEPSLEELERKNWSQARELLRRSGTLGLIGVDVPETYGGVGLDKVASIIVSESMGGSASFGATFGGQTNLVVMPILMFGTAEQKERYLPRLVSGEIVGAYALSESGSGSDALGAKARATRGADGSFVLNGEKMWITNGGFADLFIVFAKIDGEHFTAFIVEREFPGVSTGNEEHKMGLHGSSTTPLILQDAVVPAANLLGAVGKGHKVAFNVLNYGRLKLGAMCSGGCRNAIVESAKYARDRRQFDRPIASFGAIKHKLGEMTTRTYALESLLYRTAGLIDCHVDAAGDAGEGSSLLAALEEYVVEASIAKVAGSETLEYVLDENIQIHGGNGFVRDYPAERHYRDARVNRIFEGTNEINRLLIPTMIVRRAMTRGGPDGAVLGFERSDSQVASMERTSPGSGDPPAGERRTVESLKAIACDILSAVVRRHGERLAEEQEVLVRLADILIDVYAAESSVLRAAWAEGRKLHNVPLHLAAARVFVNEASTRVEVNARQALAAVFEGQPLLEQIEALRARCQMVPTDTVPLRRLLADETTACGGYLFAR